jgi:hypothetical protein
MREKSGSRCNRQGSSRRKRPLPRIPGHGAASAADVEGRARRLGFDDLDMAPSLRHGRDAVLSRSTRLGSEDNYGAGTTCPRLRRYAIETVATRYTLSGGKWSDVTEIVVTGAATRLARSAVVFRRLTARRNEALREGILHAADGLMLAILHLEAVSRSNFEIASAPAFDTAMVSRRPQKELAFAISKTRSNELSFRDGYCP